MSQPEAVAESRSYPLILRTPRYQWLQPITGIFLALCAFFLVAPLIGQLLTAATVSIDHHGDYQKALEDTLKLKPLTWQGLLYINVLLALLVPATWLIVRYVHGVSPKWLMSTRPGIRARFFAACLAVAPVAIGVQLAIGAVLPGDPNGLDGSLNNVTGSLIAMAVVVLATTPFQAMGEEYLFRGYLSQAFGALTRRPWLTVPLTSVLFALAHGYQDLPLFLDRFSFGLVAGYLVIRTGGLEAGIALHVWNNIFAFGLALALGNITDSLNVSQSSWLSLVMSLTQRVVYLGLVLLIANKMGVTSKTSAPVLLPTTASV
jgi:membrane protease YdiL (CAAX protease family)